MNLLRPSIMLVLLASLWACQMPTAVPPTKTIGAPDKLSVGEGFSEALGHYEKYPRFSWQLKEEGDIRHQHAYQIRVASSLAQLDEKADLWDSGQVVSSENTWLVYQGKPLHSRQKSYWKVRIWGEDGTSSPWSNAQSFELGLLSNDDWQAQWIGHPQTDLSLQPSQAVLATPQYLRKTFTVNGGIKQARLYITALGLFKAHTNGQIIAPDDVMTPGWTPYAKRIESLSYDLSGVLTQGENVLAARLAGGWYSGRVYKFTEKEHRKPARLLAQLEIHYEDGRRETIVSDSSWLVSLEGPIRFASIYDGERYEQALEQEGWDSAGFQGANWQSAISESLDPNVMIAPKRHAPIRTTARRRAESIVIQRPGSVVYDFGQNMVGVPRLRLPAKAGQRIRVRYAEALHKGSFYTENYRSAKSQNDYMPNNDGFIEYQPSFTYHGFRYIELSGFDQTYEPSLDWVQALVQHSDVAIHASFSSASNKLNRLANNIVWGLKGNFFDIPLDCPQRDERLGWTGDAQVFVTPSMYMADTYGFWSAWLQSMREEQGDNGKIPLYVPFIEWLNFASSGWGDAATIIPWELYVMTGDTAVLEDNYIMMKSWISYHHDQSKDYISQMRTFGDWLQPHTSNGNRGDTDFSLISTAYFARSVELTLKSAHVLGKQDDIQALSRLHKDIKHAFRSRFFDAQLNLIQGNPTQTTYLLGLAFGLFDEAEIRMAEKKLIEQLDYADKHLRTGFLGTPLLAPVLQNAGRSDLVYDLIFKETYPSWFYSINNGATTTWERWNSYSIDEGFNPDGMNSLNHYAYGSIARWFYEGILGITPQMPGFKRFKIEPQFNARLSHASGSHQSPQGEISVGWALDKASLTMEIGIPMNSTADLVLPSIKKDSLSLNGEIVGIDTLNGMSPGTYRLRAELSMHQTKK